MTGYVPAAADRPLPCPLSAEPGTWRELLERTRDAERELLAHADFPVEELLRESGLTGPRTDTVFGAGPDLPGGADLAEGAVLRVGPTESDGRPALRVRYRRDALNGEAAARIAGYHLAALQRLATEPDADARPAQPAVRRGDRVPARRAGRARAGAARPALPRAVRAAGAPAPGRGRGRARRPAVDLPGAERPGQPDRARAAAPAGWAREGVVAVATERNLDWMASVIAIFKAGGVYLPIEPHLPADRIATTLRRAECAHRAHRAGQHRHPRPGPARRCPGCSGCWSTTVYAEQHPDSDLGVAGRAGPAGLHLLHLRLHRRSPRAPCASTPGCSTTCYAKIADLEHRRGRSGRPDRPAVLRHLAVAADLRAAGRRPHACSSAQDVILDVARFVDTDRRRPGQRAPAGALLPRGRADLPGSSTPRRAARPAPACRSPGRR